MTKFAAGAGCVVALVSSVAPASAQHAMEGAEVYETFCAACHETPPDDATPPRASLEQLDPDEIVAALTEGVMRLQGAAMSADQHVAVAEYLTGETVGGGLVMSAEAMCASPAPIPADASAPWNGWGRTPANMRYAPDAGIDAASIPDLRLKWAFGIPGATQMRAQPAVFGGRLFFGSQPGNVFSIDAETGCAHWVFAAGGGVRTAINVGPVDVEDSSGHAIYFSDATATAYAVDAESGQQIWSAKIDDHPSATGTGAPTLHDGVLYVPMTGVSEESTASNPDYECCTFRGSITALDASTGAVLWKTYMTEEPQPRGTSDAGAPLWGPAGVGIWSAPTIDAQRGLLYAATGNAYADPEPGTSDSVVALDLETGDFVWTSQLLPDVWIMGCSAPPAALAPPGGAEPPPPNENCPDDVGPDYDFSASPLLVTLADGRQIIAATQKSGMGYGLDPDAAGAVLWQYRWGAGSPVGGVWGAASDGARIYFPVADNFSPEAGGLHAVDALTGEPLWAAPPQPLLCEPAGAPGCTAVQSAAATAVPGAVFSGAQDGGMRAYDAQTGAVIWTFDANREFDTVNGVEATGGSFDGPGPVAANGMLYVTSGNAGFVGRPGNVVLAFEAQD